MLDRAHAKLSASGSHRWMACPGSVRVEAAFPNSSSSYADEGTAAHDLAARCLRNGDSTEEHIGEEIYLRNGNVVPAGEDHDAVYVVDREMADAVQLYLDYVRQQPGELLIERRVDFSAWVPDGFGTSDAIVLHDGTASVFDLKYGTGVRVDAEENSQAMLYALGAYSDYGFLYDCDSYRIVIVQPRIDHISEWTISLDDLLRFADKARDRAAEALKPDAELVPSAAACRFCKARGSCKALAEHNYSIAVEGFEAIGDAVETIDPNTLSPEELAQVLTDIETLSGWADAVKSHATGILMRGESLPGFKLVEGRSVRKWGDEEAAGKALSRKLSAKVAFERKLITITKAEKLLGRGDPLIAKHTVKPAGKPTLAPESSPKPALEIDPFAGFENTEATTKE